MVPKPSIFGPLVTQIDRGILTSVFRTAHASGVPGMSVGLKTAIRNRISNSRNKTGAGMGETNSVLDQFTKMGGKVPPPGTIGFNPTQGGKDFINAVTDYADDVRTGDLDPFLPTRVPKRTVGSRFVADTRPPGLARIQSDLAFLKRNPGATSRPAPAFRNMTSATSRPAPAFRNMTSAQKGAVDARKGKKKGKKKDNSWPVEPWGSMVSDGYKKAGPKGGMR